MAISMFLMAAVSGQTQATGWTGLFYTVRLNPKFDLIGDMQFRSGDQFSKMQTLLLRAGLQYKIRSNLMVTTGYAYVLPRRTINEMTGYGFEHRVWEQLIFTHPMAFATVQHRFRLEQRFISKSLIANGEFENAGNIFANRFRYFFRSVIPFNGEKKFVKGVFTALQNEVMLQFGDKSGTNGKIFDQNRFYLALGYRLSRKFDLEAGYMNQYINGKSRNFTNNHISQLAAYLRL